MNTFEKMLNIAEKKSSTLNWDDNIYKDIYNLNLKKLEHYKNKGWSKESLIVEKIFAKSFIEKNY
jgi:hypothetical protein